LDIQRLKRETEAEHRATEDALPLMRADLDKSQYLQCLQQMYGVVAAWEERAFEVAPEWMRPILAARQRKHLLELDLAWFGAKKNHLRPTLPKMNDLPSLLGTMYVMEGSTLGGQLIARHVETTLHLSQGQGDAFFRGHGDRTGTMWKEFCELLKTRIPEDQTDAVVQAAKAMFATFGESIREKSVMDAS
jgi:heme oxygenase